MSAALPNEFAESLQQVTATMHEIERAPLVPFELRPWFEEALRQAPGKTARNRSLSEADLLWLVIALSVYRGASIRDVATMIGLQGDGRRPAASSSLSEARKRLGEDTVKQLFQELTVQWALPAVERDLWNGLSVYAMDGTTLAVPDTDANYEHFGKPSSRDAEAGYPKLRMVVLIAVRSQMLLDAQFGPWLGKGTGEQTLADGFWQAIPPHSVLLFDRGFNHVARMVRYVEGMPERHFVTRQRDKFTYETVERYSDRDERVRTPVPASHRKADPSLPEFFELRRITYKYAGHPASTILTTLLDPVLYLADEVVALYHERWSIELTYRDLKTTQLMRMESLRSKTVEGIHQEVWGILIAYQLIRKRMYDVAERHQVEPNRLSFKTSLMAIHLLCLQMHHSVTDSLRIGTLMSIIDGMILNGLMPAKKRRATYDRAVKVKMSNYPRNRGKRDVPKKPKPKSKQRPGD